MLSARQQILFDFLNGSGESAFITGKAGSGKSFLLKYFVENTTKDVVVLATTGTAALNLEVGAQTIHSFFKLKPGQGTKYLSEPVRETLKNINTIIIDEVSMLRVDLIEHLAQLIKNARIGSGQYFGGLQMIFFGDLYQLPPVVKKGELKELLNKFGGIHFFNAPTIKAMDLKVLELQESHRQQEGDFLTALNHIRDATTTRGMARKINARVGKPPEGVLTVTTTNAKAKDINDRNYAKLTGKEFTYTANVWGEMKDTEYPVEYDLKLKVGSKVQMTRNHPDLLWSNGSLGEIVSLEERSIVVKIEQHEYVIKRATWEKIEQVFNFKTKKVENEVIGTFTQYPIRLAWAITIHKSQGQTYDKVIIDWGTGTFSEGQAYTALSRCRTLEGLHMVSEIKPHYIISNEVVKEYMSRVQTVPE